jgi:anaerobic C4-dicarboxylate transporter DcuB
MLPVTGRAAIVGSGHDPWAVRLWGDVDNLKTIAEVAVLFGCIVYGARQGPLALAAWSGLALLILTLVLRLPPGSPPVTAVFAVLGVITAAAAMEVTGGLAYLILVATRLLERNPRQLTVMTGLVVFAFSWGCGTGNICFALFPIIYGLAVRYGIRPARPLAVAVVVSQMALVASPVSADMAAYLSFVEPIGWSLGETLSITLPAVVIGTVVTALVMNRFGKSLEPAPEDQQRLAHGENGQAGAQPAPATPDLLPTARRSAAIFLAGAGSVVIVGLFPALRPMRTLEDGTSERVAMAVMIPIIMFAAAAIIYSTCRARQASILSSDVFKSGVIAALVLLTVPTAVNTVIDAHEEGFVSFFEDIINVWPGFYSVAFFILAGIMGSATASTTIVTPIGISLGFTAPRLTAMAPSAGGNMLFPIGALPAGAMATDKTGSTRPTDVVVAQVVIYVATVLTATVIAAVLYGLD